MHIPPRGLELGKLAKIIVVEREIGECNITCQNRIFSKNPNSCGYVVGDCENRAAHSHNRHHELSLGFGGVGMVFSYGDSM
jgi:hypothetical protein